MYSSLSVALGISAMASIARAHIAPWHKGMYCLNGTTGIDNQNTNEAVQPLFDLPQSQWWMHCSNGCCNFPPAKGDFLELPAGGSFTVEMAGNRAQTSLSYGGVFTSEWPDGMQHPENYSAYPACIGSPNIHTYNASDVAGSAFAISYTSDITKVTPQNLVVFTVRYGTPWKRVASFDVPANMPGCPPGGCICAWGWVPNHCGEPNMYMLPYRCQVTGARRPKPLATPKVPAWCEGNPSSCTSGAKQMIYWNQASGSNIVTSGYQLDGQEKSPGYNLKNGFKDGAQNDIFKNIRPNRLNARDLEFEEDE